MSPNQRKGRPAPSCPGYRAVRVPDLTALIASRSSSMTSAAPTQGCGRDIRLGVARHPAVMENRQPALRRSVKRRRLEQMELGRASARTIRRCHPKTNRLTHRHYVTACRPLRDGFSPSFVSDLATDPCPRPPTRSWDRRVHSRSGPTVAPLWPLSRRATPVPSGHRRTAFAQVRGLQALRLQSCQSARPNYDI